MKLSNSSAHTQVPNPKAMILALLWWRILRVVPQQGALELVRVSDKAKS